MGFGSFTYKGRAASDQHMGLPKMAVAEIYEVNPPSIEQDSKILRCMLTLKI
jgi:hypothetical protein